MEEQISEGRSGTNTRHWVKVLVVGIYDKAEVSPKQDCHYEPLASGVLTCRYASKRAIELFCWQYIAKSFPDQY